MKILIALAGYNDFVPTIDYDYVVAVDGGYDNLLSLNLVPNILIGDLDSISSTIPNIEIIKFPEKKDYSDFELTLIYLNEKFGTKTIDVIGFSSITRIDHVLANLGVIQPNMRYLTANSCIELVIKSSKINYDLNYKYFSLQPFNGECCVSIKNAAYEAEEVKLNYFSANAISNQFIKNESVSIILKYGQLLLIKSKNN